RVFSTAPAALLEAAQKVQEWLLQPFPLFKGHSSISLKPSRAATGNACFALIGEFLTVIDSVEIS
ncbi:hypothetical protein ABTF56_21285, partial [Acinetobacter baumannii]